MAGKRRPGVVSQPTTYQALQRGIRQVVDVIRPTLGPVPRYVGVEHDGKKPELLDDAGLIARRIIALPDRDEDMGAMYIRNVLWRVREDVGDGTATTAILFGAILEGAMRYLAAGGNAMLLRRNLEMALDDILAALDAQAIAIESREQIESLALSLCHDHSLAQLLAETLETAGQDGRIEVRKGHGRESYIELVPGTYWKGGLIPKQAMLGSSLRRVDLHDALVLITDLEFEDPQDLAPLIRLIEFERIGPLAIIGLKFSEKVLNLLHFINRRMGKLHVMAVKSPEIVDVTIRRQTMDEIALLTGGRVFIGAAGDTLESLTADDFGAARQVWADRTFFGIVNSKGDPRAVYDHMQSLKTLYGQQQDAADRRRTLLRIGQMQGGTVTVMVGGTTERDIEQRKDMVEQTINVLRQGVREGVVPGGGIALLNCQSMLRDKAATTDPDQRAAYTILLEALEAPLRALVQNGGHDWAVVAARIEQAGAGYGCDTLSGEVVDMYAARIYDVTRVVKDVIRRTVSGAALILTTDTLIHKRNPEQTLNPGG